MSESHLDSVVHECGFTIEHFRKDYGYDAFVKFFDDKGQFENGEAYIQLKATDKLRISADGRSVLYRLATRDVKLWQDAFMPVYLVLFDAAGKVAYWVYLQRYLAQNWIRAARLTKNSITIGLDKNNILNVAAVEGWRKDKNRAMKQIRVRHA